LEEVEDSGEFSRVIPVQNLEAGRKIAKGMIGEEVSAGEFLKEVVSVKRTKEEADLISWNREHTEHIWERVLINLGLTSDEVEFFPSKFDKQGIIFKEASLN